MVIEAARPVSSGNLLLMRDSDKQLGPDAEALVLAVGGDTLFGIAALVANHTIGRPMALDLMWQVWGAPMCVTYRANGSLCSCTVGAKAGPLHGSRSTSRCCQCLHGKPGMPLATPSVRCDVNRCGA